MWSTLIHNADELFESLGQAIFIISVNQNLFLEIYVQSEQKASVLKATDREAKSKKYQENKLHVGLNLFMGFVDTKEILQEYFQPYLLISSSPYDTSFNLCV